MEGTLIVEHRFAVLLQPSGQLNDRDQVAKKGSSWSTSDVEASGRDEMGKCGSEASAGDATPSSPPPTCSPSAWRGGHTKA